MAEWCEGNKQTKKLKKPIDRQYTTALYLLRCKQMNLTLYELFDLEYGEVTDLMIESANDHEKYDYKATQDDFDHAFGM